MIRPPLKSFVAKAIIAASLLGCGQAMAYDPHEGFVRTGFTTGTYTGKELASGTYNTDINVELELWIYRSAREAWVTHGLLAHDSDLGRTRQLTFGAGYRHFLTSEAMITESTTGKDSVRIKPGLGFYIGMDINVGQFLLLPFGSVLSSYATTGEGAAVVGFRKILNSQFSIDGSLSYSYMTSVLSTVSVTANTMKTMVGFGFSF